MNGRVRGGQTRRHPADRLQSHPGSADPESEAPVIQLPLLGRHVHAPTAAIIYQFCQAGLHGNMIRVAHFDQPVFAWK